LPDNGGTGNRTFTFTYDPMRSATQWVEATGSAAFMGGEFWLKALEEDGTWTETGDPVDSAEYESGEPSTPSLFLDADRPTDSYAIRFTPDGEGGAFYQCEWTMPAGDPSTGHTYGMTVTVTKTSPRDGAVGGSATPANSYRSEVWEMLDLVDLGDMSKSYDDFVDPDTLEPATFVLEWGHQYLIQPAWKVPVGGTEATTRVSKLIDQGETGATWSPVSWAGNSMAFRPIGRCFPISQSSRIISSAGSMMARQPRD
jgi:hypothetical protein